MKKILESLFAGGRKSLRDEILETDCVPFPSQQILRSLSIVSLKTPQDSRTALVYIPFISEPHTHLGLAWPSIWDGTKTTNSQLQP